MINRIKNVRERFSKNTALYSLPKTLHKSHSKPNYLHVQKISLELCRHLLRKMNMIMECFRESCDGEKWNELQMYSARTISFPCMWLNIYGVTL